MWAGYEGVATLYLTFCAAFMPGGGFYMESKKLARRAAGAGKWTGYEGVAQAAVSAAVSAERTQ